MERNHRYQELTWLRRSPQPDAGKPVEMPEVIMSLKRNKVGTFYGISVGPGDPGLLTLKAHQLIIETSVIAYLCNTNQHAMAREIAAQSIAQKTLSDQIEIPIVMPMCNDRSVANGVYDSACKDIAAYLDAGKNVAFLCEGDAFFYGSFAYLHQRLAPLYRIEIVPGVTSVNASAAEIGHPLGLLSENIAIISGRNSDQQILETLEKFDNVAILKPGKQRPTVTAADSAIRKNR